MILFVFEGEKREPGIFDAMEKLFFPSSERRIVCSYGNNIYNLYNQLTALGEGADIVSVMREKYKEHSDSPFKKYYKTSDFSEVYLFFDYDFHDGVFSLSEMNSWLEKMLLFFDDETNNGKLYINYPMVESIRYTKTLPDKNFSDYCVERKDCNDFKKKSHEFSNYGSYDFIQNTRVPEVKQNWEYLINQNVKKANYICNNKNVFPPANKESISQKNIFSFQLTKYVNVGCCKVAVLNAFPIFLYDYFK